MGRSSLVWKEEGNEMEGQRREVVNGDPFV